MGARFEDGHHPNRENMRWKRKPDKLLKHFNNGMEKERN